MNDKRHRALPVTVVVSTKNEETAIEACLNSLVQFEQVIVVDSNSSDRTADIAGALGAEVVDFRWNGKYPKKKQWCIENLAIRNQWLLFVDADEHPTPELIDELWSIVVKSSPHDAFDIPISYFFMGRELRHGHRVVKRALIRPSRAKFPELNDLSAPGMGELEGHYQPIVEGQVGRTRSRMRHLDPDPIASWVSRHNNYSDWEAYLRSDGALSVRIRRLRSGQGQLFDRVPLKPLTFFIYCYIFRRGFLDGRAGLTYALSLSWYYWLIAVKVRENQRRTASAELNSY